MDETGPELEHRLSELRAQIDRLSLSLHLWRETQDHVTPMERRLSELTEQCSDVLEKWRATGQRHARVVDELEHNVSAWTTTGANVERETAERLQHVERLVQDQLRELRQIHEEPVKQLREQAANLTEVCLATASTARSGLDRTEASLNALQSEFSRQMSEFTREVQTALSELRSSANGNGHGHAPALAAEGPQSWPLEGVMRLHNQLRRPEDTRGALATAPRALDTALSPIDASVSVVAEPPAALMERIDSLERAVNSGKSDMQDVVEQTERTTRKWRAAVAALMAGVIVSGGTAWWFQHQANAASARVAEVEQQARVAAETANQQMVQTREAAAKQIQEARDTALRAQTISDVLAAPDLARFTLVGGTVGARYSGQMLWSRSRGLVFSATRLPEPPANSVYQVWLMTSGGAVSAGTFQPDASGRATMASEAPRVSGPVVGVAVTIEHAGGGSAPSGEPVLARASQPPALPQP